MLEGRHIALVEDDEIMGGSIVQRLELEGARVVWVKTLHRALGTLRTPRKPFDAVVCDLRLPDGSGEELFNRLCEHGTPPPFLFMTGQGAADQAVRLLRSGAADYVTKPFEMGRLLERLSHVVAPLPATGPGPWIGVSPAARRIDDEVSRIVARDEPVLILGESGTGKRLVARRIHALSDRRAAPFVSVDLTRIAPESAVEKVLEPATGALARADEGVLLLERIGAAPDDLQRGLLDHLWQHADGPRIIATEASEAAAESVLRPDLYFHLCVLTVAVPPLRARPEDAVWLMSRLFEGMNARRLPPLRGISALAEEAVRLHDWRGNGRELRARLSRAMAMARGDMIFPADLFPDAAPDGDARKDDDFLPLAEGRDAAERALIRRALEHCQGNVTEAAKLLQVGRSTLWEKMQKLGIEQQR